MDSFSGHNKGLISPAYGGSPVSPADGSDLPQVGRALWVGGSGNVVGVLADTASVTIYNVQAGTLLPLRFKRIHSTNTTATSMTNLY